MEAPAPAPEPEAFYQYTLQTPIYVISIGSENDEKNTAYVVGPSPLSPFVFASEGVY